MFDFKAMVNEKTIEEIVNETFHDIETIRHNLSVIRGAREQVSEFEDFVIEGYGPIDEKEAFESIDKCTDILDEMCCDIAGRLDYTVWNALEAIRQKLLDKHETADDCVKFKVVSSDIDIDHTEEAPEEVYNE